MFDYYLPKQEATWYFSLIMSSKAILVIHSKFDHVHLSGFVRVYSITVFDVCMCVLCLRISCLRTDSYGLREIFVFDWSA